jgi:hypothetical protein
MIEDDLEFCNGRRRAGWLKNGAGKRITRKPRRIREGIYILKMTKY